MMKRTRFGIFWATLLLALLAAAPALAGWAVMHAGPEAYDLEAVWGWAGVPNAEAVGVDDAGYTKMLRYTGGIDFADDTPSSPWAYPLNGVWGAAEDDIWAVGDKILHRDGSGWTEDTFTPAAPLNAVWGRSASDVFAVGDGGLIVHYDGTSWSAMSWVPTTKDLYDVFGDATEVKAVGADGTILSYNGSIWQHEVSPTTKDLYGVWIGGHPGWAVGEGGTLLKYKPVRNKWVAMAPVVAKDLYDVFGVNGGSEAWAVGATGKIIHFSAGFGWSKESSVTSEDLSGVWGLTEGPDVFAVGDAGVILRRDFTGQPYFDPPIYPEDAETDVPMLPKLKWKGYSDGGHPLVYKVFLDTDIVQKVGPVASGNRARWQIPMKYALAPNTTHYWQVLAKDTVSKLITLSEEWSFETGTHPYIESVEPPVARPTYLVQLAGANLGSERGVVTIRYKAVISYTEEDGQLIPTFGWVTKYVNGDFGRIVEWTDTMVAIQLAHPIYWSNLPQTVKIKVQPHGSSTWSNTARLRVEWGGGGYTGMVPPSGW